MCSGESMFLRYLSRELDLYSSNSRVSRRSQPALVSPEPRESNDPRRSMDPYDPPLLRDPLEVRDVFPADIAESDPVLVLATLEVAGKTFVAPLISLFLISKPGGGDDVRRGSGESCMRLAPLLNSGSGVPRLRLSCCSSPLEEVRLFLEEF